MTGQTTGMEIELRRSEVCFGSFQAVQPTDLRIAPGEFFSILGPSGCGKTTLLRLLSGFLDPTGGDVLIGGKSMVGIGPSDRPTALIFQNLALFPLMPIWENVAFGLEMRGWSKTRRQARAMELLEMVALTEQADKLPAQLSGGQKQRVAIARALAVEPAVLLLDEPLSALDLKLRQHMRAELKQIQARTGITFVYITHDQGEALTMSDRIAVMNRGRIVQIGTPDEVYDHPDTAFAATFVGEMNVFEGRVAAGADGFARIDTKLGQFRASNPKGLADGSTALMFVRPERMRLLDAAAVAENRLVAVVQRRDLEGAYATLTLRAKDQMLTVHLQHLGGAAQVAGEVMLGFDAADAVILPPGDMADD